MPDPAPATLRVVSAGLLGGGALAGFAAAAVTSRRLLPALALRVAGLILTIARADRRPPVSRRVISPPSPAGSEASRSPTRDRLTFSIVVVGRDEAVVLPALVADVARQDYRRLDGTVGCELIVVDDRSVDGTAEAVLAAAVAQGIADRTRIIRRDGPGLPDGKGAAWTAAQPATCSGDLIVVLDADARIGSAFLSQLAAHAAAGHDALTARRRIRDADSSALARAQADEQAVDRAIQVARWKLGGCSEFRGNGTVIRRELLASVGGWRAAALTEDLDLSSRIAIVHGVRVLLAGDSEAWEEAVRTWSGLLRQRLRWAEGALRRAIEHGPAQLGSRALKPAARLDFALYAGQLLVPPIILGAFAGAVVLRRPWAVVGAVGAYLTIGTGLAWDALRFEASPTGRALDARARLRRSLAVGLFNAVWLAAVPGALVRLAIRRGPVEYAKLVHVGAVDRG